MALFLLIYDSSYLISSVFSGKGDYESLQLMLKAPELHLKKKHVRGTHLYKLQKESENTQSL